MGIEKARFGYHAVNITEYLTTLNAHWLRQNLLEAKADHRLVGFTVGHPAQISQLRAKIGGMPERMANYQAPM